MSNEEEHINFSSCNLAHLMQMLAVYKSITRIVMVFSFYAQTLCMLYINKGRFCNAIASVAFVHTSIQSDLQMQTKEILSCSKSKQT